MKSTEEIGKLDSAKRHLATAVIMFFERKDPIVVHTVAWAAHQVISDLCEKNGISRDFEDMDALKGMSTYSEFIKVFRKPHNFFKHADKDPESILKFNHDINYALMITIGNNLQKLTNSSIREIDALRLWFYTKHPEDAPALLREMIARMEEPLQWQEYDFFLKILKKSG